MAITLTSQYQTFARADWSFTYNSYLYEIGFYAQAKLNSQSKENSQSTVGLRTIYDVKTAQRTVHFTSAHTWIHDTPKDLGETYWDTGQHVVQEITKTFNHNAQGDAKTQNIGAEWSATFGGNSGLIAGDIIMPKIERYPMITSAEDFNDEGNPVVNYSTTLGFPSASVDIAIADSTGNTILVPYRAVNVENGSYTFNLTTSERNALRNATTNSNTMTIQYKLRTTSGSNEYFSTSNKTLTIINANPTQTNTITEQNAKVVSLIGSSVTKVVKNASQLRFTITPSAKKGASISSVTITHNNIQQTKTTSPYTFDIDVVNGSFNILVTDSRGNKNGTSGETITKQTIEYLPININLYSFRRVNPTSSNIILELNADYLRTVNGTTNTYKVWYKIDNGSYVQVTSGITYDTTNNKLNVNTTLNNVLVYTSDGQFSVKVEDLLTEDTEADQRGYVTRGIPVFERGEHDIQVNGNLFVADTSRQNKKNILNEITTTQTKINNLLGATLLWTNPNPNSNFANQTLTISNLANFNSVIIIWKYASSSTDYNRGTTILYKGYEVELQDTHVGDGGTQWRRRTIRYTGDTTIVVNTAYRCQNYSPTTLGGADNSQCIPLRIYGFNSDFDVS